MLNRLGYVAMIVYGMSILGAAIAPSPTANLPSPTRHPREQKALPSQPLRGFAISLHHTDHLHLYLEAIDQMAALGFNSLEVATPVFQTNGQSKQIRIEVGPNRGPQRWQLISLLRHARMHQLTTALMPQILFTEPRGNEWRGKIQPEQWDPWWHSYHRVIDYFLDIANEASVDIFSVGSELLSTERQSRRWTRLIDHVREHFGGQLTYSTNWDHYHVPAIWRDLDMIGISGYWDLSGKAANGTDTIEQLTDRWRQIRQKVLAFATTHNRPILFTEIGYPSLPWAIKAPWNYVNDEQLGADPDAQARGYASFLAAWTDLLTSRPNPKLFCGVFFYAWDPYRQGGAQDTGYGVRGKPTLDLLKRWLARPQ